MTAPDTVIIQKYFGNFIRSGDFQNRAIAYYVLYKTEGEHWSERQKQAVLSKSLADFRKEFRSYTEGTGSHSAATNLALQSIILTEMENHKEAKQAFEQALKLVPKHQPALLDLRDNIDLQQKKAFTNLSFRRFVAKRAFQKIFQ